MDVSAHCTVSHDRQFIRKFSSSVELIAESCSIVLAACPSVVVLREVDDHTAADQLVESVEPSAGLERMERLEIHRRLVRKISPARAVLLFVVRGWEAEPEEKPITAALGCVERVDAEPAAGRRRGLED